jgi:hypothetical protein
MQSFNESKGIDKSNQLAKIIGNVMQLTIYLIAYGFHAGNNYDRN